MDQIQDYIDKANMKGMTLQQITVGLLSSGWKEEQIRPYIHKINYENNVLIGSYQINLSEGLFPQRSEIELYANRLCLNDPSIIIPLETIQKIKIDVNWLLSYKITLEYMQDQSLKSLRFSCADAISVNLYNTVFLYKCLLQLIKTGAVDTKRLDKGFFQDRLLVVFIFFGGLCFLILPAVLNHYGIQWHAPLFVTQSFLFLVQHFGKLFLLIQMVIGSAIIGLPIGYYYIVRLRKIIKEFNLVFHNL